MGVARIELTEEQAARLEAFRVRVRRPVSDGEVKVNPRHLPGDPVALRGVPCLVAGGVGGVIPGTRPGDSVRKLERDERFIRDAELARRRRLLVGAG